MAKCITDKQVVITLQLNIEEALYLKGMLQNSFAEDESETDNKCREGLFEALPTFADLTSYRRQNVC